jgi:hypothetical protein
VYCGSEVAGWSLNGELKDEYKVSEEFKFNPKVVKSDPSANVLRSCIHVYVCVFLYIYAYT